MGAACHGILNEPESDPLFQSLYACDQICPQCGARLRMWLDTCSHCGKRLHADSVLRKWGIAYLILGFGLSVAGAYSIWLVALDTLFGGDPRATMRFNGTPAQAAMIFGFLGFVFTVGVTVLAGGVFQVAYGRKSLFLTRVALVLYTLLWAAYFSLIAAGWAKQLLD